MVRLIANSAKAFALAVTLFIAAGCGPEAVLFKVDAYDPQAFNLDPQDNTVSVFAITPESEFDSTAVSEVAKSLASQYEKDQRLEEESVATYTIPEKEFPGSLPGLKETSFFESLMMQSASRYMVFVKDLKLGDITIPERSGANAYVELPFKVELSAYDAVKDSLLLYDNTIDTVSLYIVGDISKEKIIRAIADRVDYVASKIGEGIAGKLSASWKSEQWMIINYPDIFAWSYAAELAKEFKWNEAIDAWMPLTEEINPRKASYAAFNIAVACEMSGHSDLAKQWLEFARSKFDFGEARMLQNHINNRHKSGTSR